MSVAHVLADFYDSEGAPLMSRELVAFKRLAFRFNWMKPESRNNRYTSRVLAHWSKGTE